MTTYDVCDMNRLYDTQAGYTYSLPRDVMENFLSGLAFDRTTPYSSEDLAKLQADIREIFQQVLADNPTKEPVALLTAGAPGAGKTVKLRQDLEVHKISGMTCAYVCPDDVCLKAQKRTYVAELERKDQSKESRQAAYTTWRPGSNAAAHLILANVIREKYALAFGTTSSGASAPNLYKFLKSQGYFVHVIHVSAPDDVRWASIVERDKTFVQTTEQDVKEKGFLLPQRIQDTFLAYADQIDFCYRGALKQDAVIAAIWRRLPSGSAHIGVLEMKDKDLYEKIKALHNEVAKILDKSDLLWETTVEKSAQA